MFTLYKMKQGRKYILASPRKVHFATSPRINTRKNFADRAKSRCVVLDKFPKVPWIFVRERKSRQCPFSLSLSFPLSLFLSDLLLRISRSNIRVYKSSKFEIARYSISFSLSISFFVSLCISTPNLITRRSTLLSVT